MSTERNASKREYPPIKYVHIAITFALMFGFGCLPPFGTVTQVGMRILGLFLGVIYSYSTLDIVWPSLLAIVVYGLSGYHESMADGIMDMMGTTTVFQVITQNMAAGAIVIYGFGKWFARKSLSLKFFHGKPRLYTWCFMFIFMWAHIVLNTIPTSLMLYAIWNDIAETCGYSKDSTFRYYGFGAILTALMLGVSMIPYRSWQLGLATSWAKVTGVPINLGFMFVLTGIIGVIVVTAYVILGAKLFKVDFSAMQAFDVEKLGKESEHLRPRSRRIITIYLAVMLLSMYAGTFTKTALAKFLNGTLTMAGLYCLCTVVLMIIPSGEHDGKAAIDFKDIKHSDAAINWMVILMCAVTIPLASALTSKTTGILPWLTGVLTPVFEGRGPVFILIFTIVVMVFLTNIGSNIALGNAMIPIIAPFAVASGANIMVFGAALIYCCNMGLILPGSSAPASIYHARSEIPDVKLRTLAVVFGIGLHMAVSIVVYSVALMVTS